MITGKLTISGSKKDLETYYNTLAPEENDTNTRASYKISRRFGKLTITVNAKDFVAFRAMLTSILNVMAIVHKTIKTNA